MWFESWLNQGKLNESSTHCFAWMCFCVTQHQREMITFHYCMPQRLLWLFCFNAFNANPLLSNRLIIQPMGKINSVALWIRNWCRTRNNTTIIFFKYQVSQVVGSTIFIDTRALKKLSPLSQSNLKSTQNVVHNCLQSTKIIGEAPTFIFRDILN